MTPTRHPSYEMLAAYAAGTATDGVALVVAAHATYCARCRAETARIEAVAGAVMGRLDGAAMSPGALDAVLDRLDAPEAAAPASACRDGLLPAPIAGLVGPFADLRWRFVMPGVAKVDVRAGPGETATLLRVRPGLGVPQHTHTAEEATLVLCGALRDRGEVYAAGDVALADDHDDHRPRAEPGADCVCLAVLTGGLRFTGAFGRALNMFAQ